MGGGGGGGGGCLRFNICQYTICYTQHCEVNVENMKNIHRSLMIKTIVGAVFI